MKTAIAVGMVKNSADIIESFIRGNAQWADKFVLLDNLSTDRTVEILSFLKQEGFDIEIIPDDEIAYYQSEKMNALISYVYEKYQPDYIIPIDDDEILTVDSGRNIKDVLFELQDGGVYQTIWRIYTPHEKDDLGIVSVPKRITHYYTSDNENYAPALKVIITRGAIENNGGIEVIQGNHSVNNYKGEISINREIIVAHYPVRSSEQIKSKALVGWTGYLTMVTPRTNDMAYQWRIAYELSKKGLAFPTEILRDYAKIYYTVSDGIEVKEMEHQIAIPTECFEIKYTSANEINAMINYCNSVEELAKKYVELSRRELMGEG